MVLGLWRRGWGREGVNPLVKFRWDDVPPALMGPQVGFHELNISAAGWNPQFGAIFRFRARKGLARPEIADLPAILIQSGNKPGRISNDQRDQRRHLGGSPLFLGSGLRLGLLARFPRFGLLLGAGVGLLGRHCANDCASTCAK